VNSSNWGIGEVVQGHWEVQRILQGGMGVVFIVFDREWREAFAAKTFQDEVFARNPNIKDRFEKEAWAWVNLDLHENITKARLFHVISGKPFLFLEYVSGGSKLVLRHARPAPVFLGLNVRSWRPASRSTSTRVRSLRTATKACCPR